MYIDELSMLKVLILLKVRTDVWNVLRVFTDVLRTLNVRTLWSTDVLILLIGILSEYT